MDVINKKISILLLIIIMLSAFSCEESISDEDCSTYDYFDCNTVQPYEADLELHFTISANTQKVAFEIIEGTIEEGKTIIYDTATTSSITYIMPLQQYYTVKATYENSDKTIYAIDGLDMKAHSVHKCDSVCWTVPTFSLDLRLQ